MNDGSYVGLKIREFLNFLNEDSGTDITQTLLEINAKLNDISKELRYVASSQTMLSAKYDDILAELKTERTAIKERDLKITKLEQKNNRLKLDLDAVKKRVIEMDQYSRNRIEING